jgi:hypothetical protein
MLLCIVSLTAAQQSWVRVSRPATKAKYEKLRAVTLLASNVLPSNTVEFGTTPKTAQFF